MVRNGELVEPTPVAHEVGNAAGEEAPVEPTAQAEAGTDTPIADEYRDVALQIMEGAMGDDGAWQKLDYAYLHRYLIDELLESKTQKKPQVRYVKSADDAKEAARRESGVALLTGATPMAHLRAVSEAGGLMPPKSTYFHPKLATGLTINPLA